MKFAIGIDLGGTNTKIGLVNDKGKIVRKEHFSTKGFKGPDPLIEKMVIVCLKLLHDEEVRSADFCGIGIGVPGIVDSAHGIIYNLTNIFGWKNVHLKAKLQRLIPTKVYVDNDVNLMALGELHYGAAQGAKNIVCVTLGTGVGGGVIVDGKLYRGSTLSAGEIGHMTVDQNGPACNCGNRGCLEAYVGNQRIVESAVKGIRSGQKSLIAKLVDNDLSKVTPEIISKAADRGDKFAKEIWRQVGECLGVVFAGLVNFFNPDMFVVGGGVAAAGPVMFDALKKTVRERSFKIASDKAKIVLAKLGNDAGIIGAATIAMVHHKYGNVPFGTE